MKKILFLIIMLAFVLTGKAQSVLREFDTLRFNENLALASNFIECEFYTQLATSKFSKTENVSSSEWFSYKENNSWHTFAGDSKDNSFKVTKHLTFDSLYTISENTDTYDSVKLVASGSALSLANTQFQIIRDTCNLYFNSFVNRNPDQTVSIWFLPAFQPSGQAVYGCEWEYVFDKTGKKLLRQNSFTNIMTGVWIGQPRELWLNYRNSDKPTVGSVFFSLSFRDYFTRIRIDTRKSTSTTTKDSAGDYTWTHKLK